MILSTGNDAIVVCLTYTAAKWAYWDKHSNFKKIDHDNIEKSGPNKLIIHSVTMNNFGRYECEGTDEDGLVFYARMEVVVLMQQGSSRWSLKHNN